MMRWRASQLLRNSAAATPQLASSNSKGGIAELAAKHVVDGPDLGARGHSFFGPLRNGSRSRVDHFVALKQLGWQRENNATTVGVRKSLALQSRTTSVGGSAGGE